jgi:hypothetical protein
MKTPRQLVKVPLRRGVFVRMSTAEARAIGWVEEPTTSETPKKAAAPQNKKTAKPRNKKAEELTNDDVCND